MALVGTSQLTAETLGGIKLNLLNAGCGTHYAKGWVNTDVWNDGKTTTPDIQVTPNEPYPFPDNHFDAVFLGHVIEHIAWPNVFPFLMDMQRVAKPGAPILICGPDVLKTIKRWSQNHEPWEMVLSTMEHQDINTQPGREHLWWDGAHHHWNCHHQRVWNLLEKLGFENMQDVFDSIPKNPQGRGWNSSGINWPVVGHWHWHFAILCTNPQKP
jgi:SAM-dependent methyltransferase